MLKRSQINTAISQAILFFKKRDFPLPPFAFWTVNDWKNKGIEYQEIKDTRIGWDVTDFGSGDFLSIGRTIFTLRNGKSGDTRYLKSYAQKVMYLAEGQKSVIHYHKSKMEDIINNGGGNILICFWKAGGDNCLSKDDVEISVDGKKMILKAGEELKLTPGESVSIRPRTYHKFWAQEGQGNVISMEVSSVCDDLIDNYWFKKAKRFPEIEEDEPKKYLLCSEYM